MATPLAAHNPVHGVQDYRARHHVCEVAASKPAVTGRERLAIECVCVLLVKVGSVETYLWKIAAATNRSIAECEYQNSSNFRRRTQSMVSSTRTTRRIQPISMTLMQ